MSYARIAPQSQHLCDGFVVALHGSALGPAQWLGWQELMPAAVDFISPSLIGYGRSSTWQAGQTLALADEAARLEPLLALARDGVHLVGHSYGGAVAMEVARLWPARVRTLSLYEPSRFSVLRAFDPVQWQCVHRLGRNVELEALSSANESAGRRFMDFWSGPGAWDSLAIPAQQRLAQAMPKVQAEFDALFADTVPLHAWSGLKMPVHLICGDDSPEASKRIVDRLEAVLPNVRVQRLRGAGHMAPVTEPRIVMQALGLTDEQVAMTAL